MRKTGRVWKWISGTALAAVLLLVLAPQTARAEGSSVSTWGGLQEQFNSASTDTDHPTEITLDRDYVAGTGDSALEIPTGRYVTLDLNGHTIDRGLATGNTVENGNVITVKGDLTITDSSEDRNGKLTGGNNNGNGGGVIVDSSAAVFTLNGGNITGCISGDDYGHGGGVAVENGRFIMNDGSISHCTGEEGGGVYVAAGTFDMNGGTISENTGSNIGGVYVDGGGDPGYGIFNMNGGTISRNTGRKTGGVAIHRGSFSMAAGTISGNTATDNDDYGGGGLYISYGTFAIKGTPVINSNTKNGSASNIVFSSSCSDKTIKVTGELGTDAEIWVNADQNDTVAMRGIPQGGSNLYNISDSDAEKFHSDKDSSLIGVLDDDEVKFFSVWGSLQAKFNNASTNWNNPTEITLSQDYESAETDSGLTIPGGRDVALNLNGHYILYKGKNHAPVITLGFDQNSNNDASASLILKDSAGSMNTSYVTLDGDGRATSVGTSGQAGSTCIEVSGGFIAGGTGTSEQNVYFGGGVYVKYGDFTMQGGTIVGCTASFGAGVSDNGGYFTMAGGSITGCRATKTGGGVIIRENNSEFNMTGGRITGCTAASSAGGVRIENGTFNISGTPVISGNKADGNDSNVVNITNNPVNITGPLDSGVEIHVYPRDDSDIVAQGSNNYTPTVSDAAAFYSDVENRACVLDESSKIKWAQAFRINVDGSIDNGTVTASPTTAIEGATVTLTITPDSEYVLDTLTITDENHNELIVSGTGNTRTFTMPADHVTVDASFAVAVAQVGGVEYATVQGAIDAAVADDTVTLLRNVDIDQPLDITSGKIVTLDLNGHTIDRGLSNVEAVDGGNVITVGGNLTLADSSTDKTGKLTGGNTTGEGGGVSVEGGKFTMSGGTISDCSANHKGGGVLVQGGTFTMSGGTIDHCNAADSGGGVSVEGGKFTMSGGTIINCKAGIGGGVFVTGSSVKKGMFIMESGGAITGCNAVEGGGVYVDKNGTFNMDGGTISACNAIPPASLSSGVTYRISGGGVRVNKNGTFNMDGGTISACTAISPANPSGVTYSIFGGGVYVENNGAFDISGAPVIKDNKKDNSANNVVLDGGNTITVIGTLTDGAELHINADKGTMVAQIGGSRTNALTATEAGYFKSDVDSNLLGGLNEDGQVVLKEPLPALTGAADLTYNGTARTPALTFEGATLTAGTDYTVSYKKVVGDTETELSGAPKDAGRYKAVAAGKGSYAGTSEASFTIAPKAVTVGGIRAKNKVYDTTTTAELDCSGATFAGKADGDILTVSGTGTFENANAGKVKTVTISGRTLGGDSKDNYVLAQSGHQTTTTATITRATPKVTAPTASATYMENLSNVGLNNPTGNLSGTWTWATDNGINLNETAVGAIGTHVFRAKFTPTDTANYCETTKDVTVTVGKAMPHLTIDNFSAPYGHPVSVKITCDSDGEVTYVFYKNDGKTMTNTEDGAEKEGGAPKNAGTYDIKASVAETSNYLSNEQTLDDGCEITPAPNPAVLRPPVTVKRGSDYDLSGLVSSDAKGTVSFALKEPQNGYSLSGSTLTLANTTDDSCTITVTADGTVDGKSNYETFSGEIIVNATNLLPQDSFRFKNAAQKTTYGDGDFTVAATGAETGSNVTYSSGNPDVATVEAETGKVHILKAGETTIIATAGATATYASATASYKLMVNPKPVTISGITAADMEYNADTAYQGMTLNTASAVIAGKLEQDDLTVSAIGMCDADVGKNKTVTIRITLGGSSAGNYTVDLDNSQQTTTINITKADIPDTAITAPTGKAGLVYTGLAQALVDAGTAQVRESEMRYALGTATTAPEDKLYSASIPTAVNAGTYYVWYMVKGDRNHNDSSSNGPVTVTIEKASGGTINADAVEVQKGNNIAASVNIRGHVGTGAVIKDGTSPQVTPDHDPSIGISDINVSNDNLTFTVSSANGGNAIITVTLKSDNYADVTLTIPVKVQDKTTEVKLNPPSGVTSAVQGIEVQGLSDYTQSQNTPNGEPVKVVLEVKPVSEPEATPGQTADQIKTAIDKKVTAIFNTVNFGNTNNTKTEYLDIKVSKQVGSGSEVTIGDVEHVLEIAVKYDLTGKFNPVVIREHEGVVTAFTALNEKPSEGNYRDGTFYIDEDLEFIYIYSRYFSTFSIASSTVNSHTVSFDSQGGSSVDPIIVADGGKISILPTTTRSGYTLDGWFTYASGGEKLTTDTVITADITYCAQWTKNTSGGGGGRTPSYIYYTVRFELNGHGEAIASQSIRSGQRATKPADPVAIDGDGKEEGFTFAGWYTDAECETAYDFTAPVTAGIVLYAKWTEDAGFTVRFDLNGVEGTAPEMQTVKNGQTATKPADPEAEGFSFTGWYTSAECKELERYDFAAPVTADLVLYAGWEKGSEEPGPGPEEPEEEGFTISFANVVNDPYEGLSYNEEEKRYETAYTGSAIKPAVIVRDRTGQLREGTDYTLKYSGSTKAGKAKLIVSGRGNYSGSTELEYTILPADLAEAREKGLLAVPEEFKVEKGKKLSPVLFYGTYQLQSSDFTLSSTKAITEDTEVELGGKGNFNGTISGLKVRVLTKEEMKKAAIKVTLKAGIHIYDGSAQELICAGPERDDEMASGQSATPELTVKDVNGAILKEGEHYSVSYSNNIEAGTAKLIVTGIGGYTGSVNKSFRIRPDKSSEITAALSDPAQTIRYDPKGAKPAVTVSTVRNGETVTLREGKDYKVSYSRNKKVGSNASYTISFLGNYKGHKAIVNQKFTIAAAPFTAENVEITAPDLVYAKPGKYRSAPYVSIDGVVLKKGYYTVEYFIGESDVPLKVNEKITLAEAENEKTITVKVTGKGNYEGKTVSGSYRVTRAAADAVDLTKAKIMSAEKNKAGNHIALPAVAYTGKECKPDITVLVKNGKKWIPLDPSTYTVTYLNNVEKGKATVLVTGKESQTVGSRTARFTIKAGSVKK